jgi:hypothetical protein
VGEMRLHPDDLARLADLVADALAARSAAFGTTPRLVDAATVAQRFGVTAQWVRENAEQLGAVRLGDGPRPRLRFDLARVADTLNPRCRNGRSECRPRQVPEGVSRCARGTRAGNEAGTLPIRTLQSRSSARNKVPGRRGNAPGPATRSSPSPRSQRTPRQGGGARSGGSTPPASNERSRHG